MKRISLTFPVTSKQISPLSQQETGTGPLDHYAVLFRYPPILLSLALKRELAAIQSVRERRQANGNVHRIARNVSAGPEWRSRQRGEEEVVLHEGSGPTTEGCCFSLPNNIMTHPGRKILPPWGYLERRSLRVIRD